MTVNHTIVVTGALGQIAYNLIFRIISGELLGPATKFDLMLLDLEPLQSRFPALIMEIEDAGSPVLRSLRYGSDPDTLFQGATIVFMLGAKPRSLGMERKELLKDNGLIFQNQGRALSEQASRDVRVLVVGNPCNTNCLIAYRNAPKLRCTNFCAMSALDEFRGRSLLARKIGCPAYDISPIAVWGNHSSSLVPDAFFSTHIPSGKQIDQIIDRRWLSEEYLSFVQARGAEVIKARGSSSAASAAASAMASMKSWLGLGEPYISMCRLAIDNPYGIEEGIVFSFPTRCNGGWPEYAVDRWPEIAPPLLEAVRKSEAELLEERASVEHLLPKAVSEGVL